MTKNYDFKKSREQIGILHPAIRSKRTGKIIIGNDRLKDDPTWKVEDRDFKNEEEELVVGIADNIRRNVSKEETKMKLVSLFDIYKKEGIAEHNIVSHIAKRTGFTYQYVNRLLKNDPQKSFTNKPSKTATKRIDEIQKEFDFLSKDFILKGLKNPIVLCKAVANHYVSIKEREALSKSDANTLIHVTFANIEDNKFPKLTQESLNFIKFLYSEYFKEDAEE